MNNLLLFCLVVGSLSLENESATILLLLGSSDIENDVHSIPSHCT